MTKKITPEIKEKVSAIIDGFNKMHFKDYDGSVYYLPAYKGRFLYLHRFEFDDVVPVLRLTYTGDMNDWEFAIYKFTQEAYDPEECFFPGFEKVDGTLGGAMLAGLEAYPV